MFNPDGNKRHRLLALSVAAGLYAPLAAADVEVDETWSGIWNQPDHESQGFIIQIAESDDDVDGDGDDDDLVSATYWFTYGEDMKPHWLLGLGPVVDDTLDLVLYQTDGIGFLSPVANETGTLTAIGSLQITFEDCDNGVAVFASDDPAIGEGEIDIERLTTVAGLACEDDDDDDSSDDDDDSSDDDESDDDDDDSSDDDGSDDDDDDSSDDDGSDDDDDDSSDDDGSDDDDDDDSSDDDDSDDDDDDSSDDDGSPAPAPGGG
jgi:hypothetical protein